jgi:hypothetical protein
MLLIRIVELVAGIADGATVLLDQYTEAGQPNLSRNTIAALNSRRPPLNTPALASRAISPRRRRLPSDRDRCRPVRSARANRPFPPGPAANLTGNGQ